MSDENEHMFKKQSNNAGRPQRVEPPAPRPEPKKRVESDVSPWFVSEEEKQTNGVNDVAKKTAKRTIGVIAPMIGVVVTLGVIALILLGVGGIYE